MIQLSKIKKGNQYVISALTVCLVAFVCYWFPAIIEYRVVAYILLITVSLIAMMFDILPVLLSALLSALIWDFFFIPPRFTFHIGDTEDSILLLMYFIVAMVNAALTYKIRQMEKAAQIREEKENTVKLYNTLLNSLSHELRTPIATIVAATDNLHTNTARLTPKNRYDLVAEISKAAFRLNQQVENLLNMSRLETGFIQPKNDWCDINDLVYEVVKRLEETKLTQKLTISINPDIPLFKLDKGMLEQIIYNLLINASRYTPPHTQVCISATVHADVLKVIIDDEGPGFPKEEIKLVFDKFYRLKNTATGGTGLGLSIVKGFTEAMNGTITLRNKTQGGTEFTLAIPAETSYPQNLKYE